MFAQVSTPVLGVVENMAGYVCPACGTEDAVFGAGGGERLAAHFDVPLLARIPLAPRGARGRGSRAADRGRRTRRIPSARRSGRSPRASRPRYVRAPRAPVVGVSP